MHRVETASITGGEFNSSDSLPGSSAQSDVCAPEDACSGVSSSADVGQHEAGAENRPIRFAKDAGEMQATFQTQMITGAVKEHTVTPDFSAPKTTTDPTFFVSQSSTEVRY